MNDELKDRVRQFIVSACEQEPARPPEPASYDGWRRGERGDAHRVGPRYYHRDIRALPGYSQLAAILERTDPIRRHVNALVGVEGSFAVRMDVGNVLGALLSSQEAGDGRLAFSEDAFSGVWARLERFFENDDIDWILVAPIYGLREFRLPFAVAPNIEFVEFTDEELTYLANSGVLALMFGGLPLIEAERCAGVRVSWRVKKRIGNEPPLQQSPTNQFGELSIADQYHLVDDVLAVLRLVGCGRVSSPGFVARADIPTFSGYSAYRRSQVTQTDSFRPKAADLQRIRNLWSTLADGLARNNPFIEASLRRFTLGLDRSRLEDRLVDLMIAAEALFLNDAGTPQEKGELKFRLALRAAKFVGEQNERALFALMKLAYDARSEVVHSGRISGNTLRKFPDGSIQVFTDQLEDVLRRSLVRAIDLASDGRPVNRSDYWDGLLFPASP